MRANLCVYHPCMANVYLAEVVLTVHRGRYSISDWCGTSFAESHVLFKQIACGGKLG